jgi:N-acetylneuraminic acid mutarotase
MRINALRSTKLAKSGYLAGVIIAVLASSLTAQDGTWTTKAPMPAPRLGIAAGVANGVLYVVGEQRNYPSTLPLEAYGPSTDSWANLAPAPVLVNGAGVGTIDGVLYFVGGMTTNQFGGGEILGLNQAYNPSTNTWTGRAHMPTARVGAGVAVVDGILYAIGGDSFGQQALRTVEAYDPKTNSWTTKAPMPTPRTVPAVVECGGLIYALGGYGAGVGPLYLQPPLSTVERYDPKTDTWTSEPPIPIPMAYSGAGVLDGLIYVVGGVTGGATSQTLTAAVYAFDPERHTWSTVTPMPTARGALGVGVIAGTLYAVGGSNGSVTPPDLIVNEAFTPFEMVSIDIKPGDPTNTINLKSNGVVPVAILGSATFDPMTVDPTTVTFAGAPVAVRGRGVPMTAVADVNHDGYPDLILYFRTQELTALQQAVAAMSSSPETPGGQRPRLQIEAVLYGTTYSGQRIRGSDTVRIVPAGGGSSAGPAGPAGHRPALQTGGRGAGVTGLGATGSAAGGNPANSSGPKTLPTGPRGGN